MDLDEAIAILLDLLRNGRAGSYGYDLYARTGAEAAARQRHPHEHYPEMALRELSPTFFEAAWELCRRGIVRPGVRRSGEQAVEEGGYSLTVAGRAALANLDNATILIAQPGSLAATFNGYQPLRRRISSTCHGSDQVPKCGSVVGLLCDGRCSRRVGFACDCDHQGRGRRTGTKRISYQSRTPSGVEHDRWSSRCAEAQHPDDVCRYRFALAR